MEESILCGKCKGETFSRIAHGHEGLVVEHYCPYDGWVKPLLISLLGRIVVKPSTTEDWKPEGCHQQRVEAGKLGGQAMAERLKENPLWRKRGKAVGSFVGPYKRREPKAGEPLEEDTDV